MYRYNDFITINKFNNENLFFKESFNFLTRETYIKDYIVKEIVLTHVKLTFYNRDKLSSIENENQGIYILYSILDDNIISYVGKSKDIVERQKQHAKDSKKDILTKGVLISRPDNGFTESDVSNFENCLYLSLKTKPSFIMCNSNIPAKDKSIDISETYILDLTQSILSVFMNHLLGDKRHKYISHLEEDEYCLVQNGFFNVRISKKKKNMTGFLRKGSIFSIKLEPSTPDEINKSLLFKALIKKNHNNFQTIDNVVQGYQFYKLTNDIKVNKDFLKSFFNGESQNLFLNKEGIITNHHIF
jgi:hypothetical protein